MSVDKEIFFLFKKEALDFLDEAFRLARELEKDFSEKKITEIYSKVHTIKGESSFFGLMDVANSLHKVEDILEQIKRKGKATREDIEKIGVEIEFARSRIMAVDDPGVKDPEEIAKIIRKFFERYLSFFGKKAELSVDFCKRIPENLMSEILLILITLLKNSIEHGIENPIERKRKGKPEVGKIRVYITCENDKIKVGCEDDGKGFSSETLEKVKKGENLGSSDASVFWGRGMGLKSVLSIAEKYGGKLNIKTDGLTVVECEIPLKT